MASFQNWPASEKFIPCTTKLLAPNMQILAMTSAVLENPANRAPIESLMSMGIDLGPQHIALVTSKYWQSQGRTLTVGFMEPVSTQFANKILSHMNAWNAFCNMKFVWTQDWQSAQVRITLQGDGYWSYLGTDILHIPANEPTMCLQDFSLSTRDSEYNRVVRHETGHTLGFAHEHMRAEIINLLDVAKTLDYFWRTQGWNAATVRAQVLNALPAGQITATPQADTLSIMCYQLPGSITKNGQPIPGGTDIDATDREFAAKLYPLDVPVTPPAPPPVNPPTPPAGSNKAVIQLDFGAKQVTFSFPSDWTGKVVKQSDMISLTTGDVPMLTNKGQVQLEIDAACKQLQDMLGTDAGTLETAKQHAIFGGPIAKIVDLIAAIQAKDWGKAWTIIKSLGDMMIGQIASSEGGGTITFQAKMMAEPAHGFFQNIDWTKILGIVGKLLPLILTAAGG